MVRIPFRPKAVGLSGGFKKRQESSEGLCWWLLLRPDNTSHRAEQLSTLERSGRRLSIFPSGRKRIRPRPASFDFSATFPIGFQSVRILPASIARRIDLGIVPEPSSPVLAALGLIGVAAWAWRDRAL